MLAIGQASHAWVSGQLARAWGNEQFGVVEPWEEVCLAAEQHDVGMAAWDLDPTRDPDTGLPYSFMEMPLSTHMELWTAGPRRLVSQSRYAALLVSMHGARLYERRDLELLADAEADAVRSFLEDQRSLQAQLRESLPADPRTAAAASEWLLKRNSRLIWTWDYISLALCLDWAPTAPHKVPGADDETLELVLTPAAGEHRITLEPWPFTHEALTVRAEGRRLTDRYGSDAALRSALLAASWETLEFELLPAA
jgi:hypothetical protein